MSQLEADENAATESSAALAADWDHPDTDPWRRATPGVGVSIHLASGFMHARDYPLTEGPFVTIELAHDVRIFASSVEVLDELADVVQTAKTLLIYGEAGRP